MCWDLRLEIRLLPFVEAVGRDQAAAAFEGCPKRRLCGHGLGAGIDRRRTGLGVFRPRRHEAPTHDPKLAILPRLANDGHALRRGNIVAR